MADMTRCPNCGDERPAGATEGLCPRCLDLQATMPADPAIVAHADPSPETLEAAPASTLGGTTGVTGGWTPEPSGSTLTASARPGLPRGAVVRYFGDYQVQKELGRGGMGVVYQARQVTLNRPVALKMIKAGVLADDAELRRFQNEAEAVALLDHPGIVPVYEVGEHDGQRYFSMKLVEGGNLAEQLASFKDDPGAAATLLSEVAEAVHHAHMRGILHRDLKPANILVDTVGHPHVTDFGLAKRVEGDIEMTVSGAILGTPAYMSPEQAAGRRGTITTATDVYGLGAILYALLTGKAPFGGESVMDTLQAVKDRPPEPPRKRNPGVPRDLEVIALKCLEKDPRRRYSSAQALADDLHRWLGGRPISAHPVGVAERAWLWCKREPAIAALTASVVLAAIGGTAAVIVVQAGANRVLTAKNAELAVEKARVQQRFELAQEAIRTFHTGVSEDVLLKQKEFETLRTKLLRGARDFYRKLETLLAGRTDRASRMALGRAYLEVSEITSAIESGDAAAAVARDAATLFETLSREDAADRDARHQLGRAWNAFGSIRTGQNGGKDEARIAFTRAREVLEPLARAEPPAPLARRELAETYVYLAYDLSMRPGRANDGIELIGRARAILEDLARANASDGVLLSQLASLCSTQAILLGDVDRVDASLAANERARAIMEGLVRANPTDARYGHDLVRTLGNMATGLDTRSGSKVREQLALLERALAVCKEMERNNPTVLSLPRDEAWISLNLADCLIGLGRDNEARPRLERSRALREALLQSNPNDIRNQTQLHEVLLALRAVDARAGRLQEAREARKRARDIRDRLIRANRDDHSMQNGLASSLTNRSKLLLREGRAETTLACTEEAVEGFGEAVAIRERLVKEHPEVSLYRGHLAYTLRRLGHAERVLGDPAAGVVRTIRAVSLLEAIPNKEHELRWELACGHAALAGLAGVPGSGLSAADGQAGGDRAMVHLRKLIDERTVWFEEYREDPALQALRDRPDFRLLLLDQAMPVDPFAP